MENQENALTLAHLQSVIPNNHNTVSSLQNTPGSAAQQNSSNTNNNNTPNVNLSIYIPPSSVGTIIGRQGRTIISIQKEASKSSLIHHVKVNVMEHNNSNNGNTNGHNDSSNNTANDGTSSDWSRVLIRSDACGVFAAAKGIINIMGDYDVDPDVVLEVPLSRYKQHGAVVGKKGCVIAGLSANHNVRIYVPPNSKHDPEGKASNANVQLEGELENVEKCLVEMLAIVSGRIAGNTVPPVAVHLRGAKLQAKQQKNQDEALTNAADDGGAVAGGDDKMSTQPSATTKSQKKKAGKEDGKNTDTLVIVAPENAVTPSLGQLRQIGKKTSTIIRRKRVPVNGAASTAAATEVDDEEAEDVVVAAPEQEDGVNASSKASNKKGNFTTEFTITGRSTSLATVQSFFDRFFAGEPVDSVLDSIAPIKKSSGNGRSKKRGSKGNSGKGKGSSNRQQNEPKSEDVTGASAQSPGD
mmetsp:Transcript_8867/g.13129  ORF Transcript_8867/g.13129 Transcript_8867/m.13129 type:complete len:468 (-) Transcript_8867:304-1707(-)|eukprot:CAMPEP_0116030618 /NCGR_PEP_ID=MMETSP0321-20121206/16969_1 /TAXON_ID=163516 /ORGANISM="Leptocylindrus danicus var. danicus, Strain B650" /LENGTH=467 /DNA_ID=CAMNT_0003505473 /DNA_START=95 /DNA_END=1498 /DNA_ORIENTATION=-